MKRSEIDVTPLRQSNLPIIFVLGEFIAYIQSIDFRSQNRAFI